LQAADLAAHEQAFDEDLERLPIFIRQLLNLFYQYDPDGRMKWSANLDGSNPATSVYDGLGQRVQTTQAGVTKRYFYDINGSVVAVAARQTKHPPTSEAVKKIHPV
jgi:hypothetical protein